MSTRGSLSRDDRTSMHWIEEAAKVARRLLTPSLFWRVHGLAAAFLTPIRFSRQSGHFRSSITHRPVDPLGRPIPWITYPAIHFLEHHDLSSKKVLEWGSGNSTLWWAQRAAQVVCFESDEQWFKRISSQAPQNVTVKLINDDLEDLAGKLPEGKFDLIVIDGLDRLRCAQESLGLLAEGGGIVVDDSEQGWSATSASANPIVDLMASHGFRRIDFYGHAPGVIRRHCTSLFVGAESFLLAQQRPPWRYD